MNDRDFKGVWIPKEIWLNKDLSALDRVLLAEIDSLNNENHCWASNEYFAEFCGVSIPTITRSIKKLKDLGYIEELPSDGRHRILTVISLTNQNDEGANQNDYPASSKRLTNNIKNNTENNLDNTNTNSTMDSLVNNFLSSGKKQTSTRKRGKSLFDKCLDEIYSYTNNIPLQESLKEYLNMRLQMKDKPLKYANQWKGLLNQLSSLAPNDISKQCAIIQQSIRKGWAAFYEIKTYSGKEKKISVVTFGEHECMTGEHSTQEQIELNKQKAKEREQNGQRAYF